MSEQTRLRYVPPGCQTGIYYITVCNLYMRETPESLKYFTEVGCVVDHIQIYPSSTSGWVRLQGSENFERAWARLYKGIWHNRVIEAFDKNRHEGIMIKELVEDTEGKAEGSPEIQQSSFQPVCTHTRSQLNTTPPPYVPFGQPYDTKSHATSPDGGVPISPAPWPLFDTKMCTIPSPRQDPTPFSYGVSPYPLAGSPETWSPIDTPSTGFSMLAGPHYGYHGASPGETTPPVYPTPPGGSSVCHQGHGPAYAPPPAAGYAPQACVPPYTYAPSTHPANQRRVGEDEWGARSPRTEHCMMFVSGIRFSADPECFKAWVHWMVKPYLASGIRRINVPCRKGFKHKLRGFALITFQNIHFASHVLRIINKKVFHSIEVYARFAKRGLKKKKVHHSTTDYQNSDRSWKHELNIQPGTNHGGLTQTQKGGQNQNQKQQQQTEAMASPTSRGHDDPPLVVNGSNYRG